MANGFFVIEMSAEKVPDLPQPEWMCGHGWCVVDASMSQENRLAFAKSHYEQVQQSRSGMYPDGVVELNSLSDDQDIVKYRCNWYEDLTSEQIAQFRSFPHIIKVEETDWVPWD